MPKFVAEMDELELCVRMAEVGCSMKRPPGQTAQEAWAELSKEPMSKIFQAQARAAMLFFQEHLDGIKAVS